MRSRVKWGLLATAVCVMASPAVASASNAYMSFGPVKLGHGYALTGTAGTQFPGSGQSDLELTLSKTSGGQTQLYGYDYAKKFSLKTNASLSSGTLKASFGSYGTLSLKFAHTGALKKIKDPTGCKGPRFQSRAGKVTGTLSFKTHTSFFENINARRAKASLTKFGAGKENCGATGNMYALTMGGDGTLAGNLLSATKESSSDTVRAGYNQFASATFPFNLFAQISQDGSSVFSPQANLSSAHLAVSGPFMSGTSSFTETSACESTSDYVYGSLRGTVTAHFDIGGTQTYGSDGEATLVKNFAQCATGCATSCGTGGTGGTTGNEPLAVQPSCNQDDSTVPTIECADDSFGGTQPYSESWDWGDGSPRSTGASPTHTYAGAGTYTVSETVRDAKGATQIGQVQVDVTTS
jgi:hypothetical protein